MNFLFILLCGILSVCHIQAQENELSTFLHQYNEAKKLKSPDSLAVACANLAEYYSSKNADSLLLFCHEGLKVADKNKVEPYLKLLDNLSVYYNAVGDNRKGIDLLNHAVQESERLKASPVYRGAFYSSLGVLYRRASQPDSALCNYNKALQVYEEGGEECKGEIPFLLTSIAVFYANSSRLTEAENYAGKAYREALKLDDVSTLLYASNTYGSILLLLEKYGEAEQIMEASLARSKKEGASRFVLQCASPLIALYSRTGDVKALDKLVLEMQPWLDKLPESSSEVLGYYENMAMVYANEKDYGKSNEFYFKLLKANFVNNQAPSQYIYLGIARNMAGLKNVTEAAEYYEKANAVKDSIYGLEISGQLSEFSARFDAQQKDLEIAHLNEERLKQDNRIMKWTVIVGLVFAVLILWLIYDSFRRSRQRHEAELEVARSFIDGLEKERSRLSKELHDGICNDLLGIGMMLSQADRTKSEADKEIIRCVEEVRMEVRAISHELTPPKFQYASLDEIINNMLHELFSDGHIQAKFIPQGEARLWPMIPERVSYEVYRIVQELSSNVIVHSGATELTVMLAVTPDLLTLTLCNNGREFSMESNANRGIGFSTVQERLLSVNGHLSMEYKDGIQIFRVEVPLSIG